MKTNKKNSKNIETVLKVLNAEIRGDVKSALKLLSKDYSMTWVYQGTKELFPNTTNEVQAELEEVYPIKGREYDIKNITESRDVVMVEMIESYPDPETFPKHVWAQVLKPFNYLPCIISDYCINRNSLGLGYG